MRRRKREIKEQEKKKKYRNGTEQTREGSGKNESQREEESLS